MEKYSDIIQFSRDLFLHSYEEMPFPHDVMATLNPPSFIRAAVATLDMFRDGFCSKFSKVYKKRFSEAVDTDEQFFRYVLPRCLKLVDDDNYYFSFMLVAAFISELIYHLTFRRDCYRFAGVAHKCLVAVFKRRLEEAFEKNGGWKGLRLFCEKTPNFDPKFKTFPDVLTDGDCAYKKRVFQRIEQCDILIGENFSLTDYELLLISIDDQLEMEAELNIANVVATESPLEVEWTMVKDNECVKVCSRFDDESGTVVSTLAPGSDAELPAGPGSDAELPAAQVSSICSSDTESTVDDNLSSSSSDDDDDDDNDSCIDDDSDKQVPDLDELATDFFASIAAYHFHPTEFDQKMSTRVCKWCNKRCFHHAKYFFLKHKEMSLKPEKFRKTKYIITSSIKAIGKMFSKYI